MDAGYFKLLFEFCFFHISFFFNAVNIILCRHFHSFDFFNSLFCSLLKTHSIITPQTLYNLPLKLTTPHHTQTHTHTKKLILFFFFFCSFFSGLFSFSDIINYNDIMFPTDSTGSTYFPPIFRPTGIFYYFHHFVFSIYLFYNILTV